MASLGLVLIRAIEHLLDNICQIDYNPDRFFFQRLMLKVKF